VVVGARNNISGQYGLVAHDALGNLVWSGAVASSSDVALASGPNGELVVAGRNASGFQVNKYDAQFNALWFQTLPARGGATRVAVDGSGNIVLSGPVDTNTSALTVVLNDWLTAKLSPQGALLWSNTWGEAGINDVPNALALGADGSVHVTGLGSMVVTPATGTAYRAGSTVTLKYDSSGKLLWTGNVLASSQGVAVNPGSDGATYVAAGGMVAVGGAPQTLMRYAAPVVANRAPVAAASASTSAGVAPLAVTFSAAGSSDPDGTLASYQWNFGDGTGSSLASPSHSYAAGSYSATLTVTDNLGASATSAPIAITVSPAPAPAPALPAAQPTALGLALSTLVGGTPTTGAVVMTNATGARVRLRSNSTLVVVPSAITVPAGAKTGSFAVTTRRVTATTPVTLFATANGVTVRTKLTLTR
jgi:PKD repeat protein